MENITLNDIAMVVGIIDVCSERGAFKGAELANVGVLREKFVAFLNANKPKEEAQSEATTTTETEGAE